MSYRARIGVLALAALLAACGPGAGAQDAPPPPEVGVVEIAAQPYEMSIELAGRVTPYEISEVRPQIGGIVRSRNFQEGAAVRAGQVLYEIDPGTARAQLTSVQARPPPRKRATSGISSSSRSARSAGRSWTMRAPPPIRRAVRSKPPASASAIRKSAPRSAASSARRASPPARWRRRHRPSPSR